MSVSHDQRPTPFQRPVRRTYQNRQLGNLQAPPKMQRVQGVGRNTGRLYCSGCGHLHARCLCQEAA